jgi:hypothetical protein
MIQEGALVETDAVELFDSPNLHVKFVPGISDAESVFVTFTPRNGGRPNKKGFGEPFFSKRAIPALHFVAQWNHWWQVPDVLEAIELSQPLLAGFKRVVTYGASMGAHGALGRSQDLTAGGFPAWGDRDSRLIFGGQP